MPAPKIILELLRQPHRQRSVLPELLDFFEKDPDGLVRFLREFGGATIEVPGPALWRDLLRDEQIARALVQDPSVERQVELCMRERVTHAYLCGIYEAVTGRRLPDPPHNGTTAGRAEAARVLTDRYPRAARMIREIFGVSARAKP